MNTTINVPVTTRSVEVDAPVTMSGPKFSCVSGPLTINADGAGYLGDYTAAESIGGGRFISFKSDGQIEAAQFDDATKHAQGFINAAVAVGQVVSVFSEGKMTGLSGVETGSDYFLQSNGLFSTTPPATGSVQSVGVGIDSDLLDVEIARPIYRAD